MPIGSEDSKGGKGGRGSKGSKGREPHLVALEGERVLCLRDQLLAAPLLRCVLVQAVVLGEE